jgi:hypothetical protein
MEFTFVLSKNNHPSNGTGEKVYSHQKETFDEIQGTGR